MWPGRNLISNRMRSMVASLREAGEKVWMVKAGRRFGIGGGPSLDRSGACYFVDAVGTRTAWIQPRRTAQ